MPGWPDRLAFGMTTDVVPVLRVDDAAASAEWYARLGFRRTFEHRFEPHLPAYVGLRRDGAQLHLSEHHGDATPGTLVYLWVDDIEEVASEFGVAVDEAPWGREVSLHDLDGNRLRIAQPLGMADVDAVLGDDVVALIALEHAMWADATRGDPDWMDEHLSVSFTEFGRSGITYTRADTVEIDVGPIDATLEDLVVRPVGRDAALLTYRSRQPGGNANRTSLWVRRSGSWRLEFHQGTPVSP